MHSDRLGHLPEGRQRRHVRLLAALIVTLMLAAPAPAQAGWRIDRAKAIAAKVWQNPCHGKVTIRWAPLAEGAASASVALCRITFDDRYRLDWPPFCTLMIHEYGHLAGVAHSPNPRSVMFATSFFTAWFDERGREVWEGVDRRCRNRGRDYLRLR